MPTRGVLRTNGEDSVQRVLVDRRNEPSDHWNGRSAVSMDQIRTTASRVACE